MFWGAWDFVLRGALALFTWRPGSSPPGRKGGGTAFPVFCQLRANVALLVKWQRLCTVRGGSRGPGSSWVHVLPYNILSEEASADVMLEGMGCRCGLALAAEAESRCEGSGCSRVL
ncbi:hypothetical protein Efla_007628 [Eimeria flavescens]